MNQNLTPEQLADYEGRKKVFIEKYKELIDEYKVDLCSFPLFVPNDRGSFEIIINTELIDQKFSPIKSPFVVEK